MRPSRRLSGGLVLLALGAAAPPARAEDAAPAPANYVAGFLGTSLAYRPPVGRWDGWQRDATALVGYGRLLGPRLAVELDVGPTFTRGDYTGFALVPGAVFLPHPNVYLAARLVVPVDPETNLVLFPGVGVCRGFGRVTPILELNLSRAVGRGRPDLGVALTAGVLVGF